MDSNQSQVLLINAERFGIALAENLVEVGTPQTFEAENIGTYSIVAIFFTKFVTSIILFTK